MMESSKPRVLVLASPGLGHLIPVLQLAKHLAGLNSLHVTLFVVLSEASPSQSQLLSSSSEFHKDLEIVDITPVNVSELVSINLSILSRLSVIIHESLPSLRGYITGMESPPAALIVDLFGMEAFDMADELHIPRYLFVTSSAWLTASMIYSPTLDKEIEGEYVDLVKPIPIPGCKPIQPGDVVDPMQNRKGDAYPVYLRLCERMTLADGLFLNTWEDMESQALAALRGNDVLKKILKSPVYPIGPIVRSIGPESISSECLDWLAHQPNESVLYICFGSGGTLSSKQTTELALGLEMSQQRFIWVVQAPNDGDASSSFFNSKKNGTHYLPEGFLTRTFGRGMVISDWAPQACILAHPSIGGFLSHCGWNSLLESMMNGVPIIAWPLYSEQRMNAAMLVEDIKVAVRPEMLSSKAVVSREDIARIVRFLMLSNEGKMMRSKAKDIKRIATKAIGKDGSSYNSLVEVVKEWHAGKARMLASSMTYWIGYSGNESLHQIYGIGKFSNFRSLRS